MINEDKPPPDSPENTKVERDWWPLGIVIVVTFSIAIVGIVAAT